MDELHEARELARNLSKALEFAHYVMAENAASATTTTIADILGIPAEEASIVEATWQPWAHASVDRAVHAHLDQHGGGEWFGLSVQHHQHQDLASVLDQELRQGRASLSKPSFSQVAIGPDQTMAVVQCGLVGTRAPSGEPVVIALRQTERHGPSMATIEVLAEDPAVAQDTLAHLRTLVDEHDLLRGQVLSFGLSEHYGNQLVSFLPRPEVSADDVVLPDGVLDEIIEHVIGVGEQSVRLREYGLHLKRGLLLHGPPGTGKTHTVRHLIARSPGATVIILTGQGLGLIGQATALARKLTPAIVVCEDVDLIAQDRAYSPDGNPLLFTLLDSMDGVGADADVTFVLTTNRASSLEEALVQRPGRIDLAVEVPRPDQVGRESLLRLYAGKVPVSADLAAAAERLEGVTASAMKEVMRRAGLAALRAGGEPEVTDAVLDEVVTRFLDDRSVLTRSLLGAGSENDEDESGEFFEADGRGFPGPAVWHG